VKKANLLGGLVVQFHNAHAREVNLNLKGSKRNQAQTTDGRYSGPSGVYALLLK